MADPIDPHNPDEQDHTPDEFSDVPVEQDPLEVEPPRRAASAQFIVNQDIGSDAELREAMDPANQSLAEALRLSFRVLQVVILVLVGLFFMSGFQTIAENEGGVLTRWGKIVPISGQDSLQPGLQFSWWPYPAGEFVVFEVENRSVELRERYWPDLRGASLEFATEQARVNDPIAVSERAGFVLTRDGDIAHLRLSATYNIENPVDFVHAVRNTDANMLVRLAMQRAVVQVAATASLQELVDATEELRQNIQNRAQQVLDSSDSGITLANLTITDAIPPLAIRKSFGDVQSAQVQAEREIESARQRANQRLVNAAGERFRDVIRLINRYEDALQTGDEPRAATLLTEINSMLDSDAVSGEVAQIVYRARAYRAEVESTLGNEARRFASMLPAFEQYPEMVVKQRWLRAYANVLSQQDSELFFVPKGQGNVRLALAGLHEIKELRQKLELDRKEMETQRRLYEGQGPYIRWAEDIRLEGPGRQLRIDGDRARPLRQR